ncbi:unnamed protein product [Discosporangium mesarthrocarpum]
MSQDKFDDVTYEKHMDISVQLFKVPVALQVMGGGLLMFLAVASIVLGRKISLNKEKYYMELANSPTPIAGAT